MPQAATAPAQRDLNAEKKAIDTFTFSNNRPPTTGEMMQLAQSIYGSQGVLASQGSYRDEFKAIDERAYQGAGVDQAYGTVQHFNDPTNYAPYKGFDKDIEGSIGELNKAIESGDYEKASALQKTLMTHAGTKSSYTKAFLAGRQMAQTAYEKALSRYQRASEMEREGYKLDRASKESLAENLFKTAQMVKDYDYKDKEQKRLDAGEAREAELHPLRKKELEAIIAQKQADAAKTRAGSGSGGGKQGKASIMNDAKAALDSLPKGQDGKVNPEAYRAIERRMLEMSDDTDIYRMARLQEEFRRSTLRQYVAEPNLKDDLDPNYGAQQQFAVGDYEED